MEKKTIEDFIPFGTEWEKEMSKWSKKDLISALKKAYIELKEFKENE